MSAQPEVWRVNTPEGIFETDLETLKQWILEGCVLPTDKVSKGNLSWIDAGRVPKLKRAFNGEVTPVAEPASTSFEPPATTWVEPVKNPASPSTTACHNHPQAAPEYICRQCGALLCKECTRFVRGKVPLCSLCGDLCHEYRAVTEKVARAKFQSSGFGLADFVRAIRYPLQHKFALFGGALIYGCLLLAGFRGSLVAWMVLFGCISHVISQVAWGRLHRSFMPDWSSFSLWDDLVVPLFLGLGIMIVSWGPLIVLVFALIFGVLSGGGVEAFSIAGGDHAMGDLMPLLGAGVIIGLLALLFVGWGVFYYPMALTVAGYTQSFGSVINPLVGLDTIKRMGATYFKAFAMVIVVQVVAFVVGVIISVITSPFALPYMGNPVANFINAQFTFYFSLVIACVLGLSLFKCADRLGINVD